MDGKKYLACMFRNENMHVFLLFLAGMAIMTVIARMADSFRENLRVAQVLVRKGDAVKKGDVLFTINIEDLQEQIQQAEQEMLKYDLQIEDLERAYQKQAAQQAQSYGRAKEDYQDAQKSAGAAVENAFQEMEMAVG